MVMAWASQGPDLTPSPVNSIHADPEAVSVDAGDRSTAAMASSPSPPVIMPTVLPSE